MSKEILPLGVVDSQKVLDLRSQSNSNRLFSLKRLPKTDRPRERFRLVGAAAMSDSDLLVCLLGRGDRKNSVEVLVAGLMEALDGSLSALHRMSLHQLERLPGVGPAKAVQLKSAVELGRRCLEPTPSRRDTISSDRQAIAWFRSRLIGESRELCLALYLNARSKIIHSAVIAQGTLSKTIVHPRDVFSHAMQTEASSVLLAHNHPSGDPDPSDADMAMTRRFVEAGKLLGVPVLDHIIVATGGCLSLRAEHASLFSESK